MSRRDRDLASQLRRALSSIALNLAEGLGAEGGNARVRFETARGSLYEARAALRVVLAWGLVSSDRAKELFVGLDALGARIFGLVRR